MRFVRTLFCVLSLLTTAPTVTQQFLIAETFNQRQADAYISYTINNLFDAKNVSECMQAELRDLIYYCTGFVADELEQEDERLGIYYDRLEIDSIIYDEVLDYVVKKAKLYTHYYIQEKYSQECKMNKQAQETLHRLTVQRIKHKVQDILTGDLVFFSLENYIGDALDKTVKKILLSILKQDCVYSECETDNTGLLLIECGHPIHYDCLLAHHHACKDAYKKTTCPECNTEIERDFDAMETTNFIDDLLSLFHKKNRTLK